MRRLNVYCRQATVPACPAVQLLRQMRANYMHAWNIIFNSLRLLRRP